MIFQNPTTFSTPVSFANPYPPLLVWTFDDGKRSNYTIALKEFSERGLRGTSFITTNYIELYGWQSFYTYLNAALIKKLYNSGWETECHSHTHPDLTSLTESQIRDEMANVDAYFTGIDLPTPTYHAYPGSGRNDTVISVISEYRTAMRASGVGYMDYDNIDFTQTLARTCDMATLENLNTMKGLVDGLRDKQVLIFLTHEIVNDSPGDYQCLRAYFTELLDYIVTKGNIRIVTFGEFYRLTKPFN